MIRRDRCRAIADEALGEEFMGEEFSGVLVSDFYAAHNHYPGPRQRCRVHPLPDIDDFRQAHPGDGGPARRGAAVRAVHQEAKGFSDTNARRARRRSAARRRLEQRPEAVCRPYADDGTAPQRRLCQRVERSMKELFMPVAEPYVPSDNDAAGRSLRPPVVGRKIGGGTRSDRGAASTMALASLLDTWNAQGAKHLLARRQILASHQV